MNKSILLPFRMTEAERRLGVYGVHVYQEGKGEAEHLFRNDDPVNIYSFSKTFSSVGVGICQDEGKLKVTDSLLSYFPEYKDAAAAGSEKITLRDLLHMCSGKNIPWPTAEEEAGMDIAEIFFRAPLVWQPGEHFFYSNYCTYLLGRVVEKLTGETMRDYLVSRLFTPLGIHNPQWVTCLRGHTECASGLYLRLSEMKRMGRLLLQKGEYDGKRVVSAAYVDAMYSDAVPNGHHNQNEPESKYGYGYQVWRCSVPGAFRADGMYGQFAIVLPEQRAVITLKSHREKSTQDILLAAYEDILPELL